mmetsp:Transcript_35088/g.34757  ORF Transcript_35088/g.34757 Transcript_35088/m.34757 type:complete len:342 (-) Transcript_35088:34-1059(-)
MNEFQRTNYVGFHASTKEMLDKNLVVTNAPIPRKNNGDKYINRKLQEALLTGTRISDPDSKVVERQIRQIKSLVKGRKKVHEEDNDYLQNKDQFPRRFTSKPFMHYGFSAKKASQKKKEINDLIKKNDNKMKVYIALLQKQKRSKKPTIGSIENHHSPHRIFLEDAQKSLDISEDFHKLNIATKPIESSPGVDIRNLNTYSSQPNFETLPNLKKEVADQSLEESTLGPKRLTDSIIMQQSLMNEVSMINKSIIEKNSEHVPKQKIIGSIRKFDDRCINYHKAHKSLVDLTVGYLSKCIKEKNPEKDIEAREQLIEQNMKDINNLQKDQLLNYNIDPYSGDN